jgi:hypothetical protein
VRSPPNSKAELISIPKYTLTPTLIIILLKN